MCNNPTIFKENYLVFPIPFCKSLHDSNEFSPAILYVFIFFPLLKKRNVHVFFLFDFLFLDVCVVCVLCVFFALLYPRADVYKI